MADIELNIQDNKADLDMESESRKVNIEADLKVEKEVKRLKDLTDTDITNPQQDQMLIYNYLKGKWENLDYVGGGEMEIIATKEGSIYSFDKTYVQIEAVFPKCFVKFGDKKFICTLKLDTEGNGQIKFESTETTLALVKNESLTINSNNEITYALVQHSGANKIDNNYIIRNGLEELTLDIRKVINDTLEAGNTTWSSSYLKTRFAALSGIAKITKASTRPENPQNPSMWYIGTQAPYEIWLYCDDELTHLPQWYDLGSTAVELSDYYTKVEIDNAFARKEDSTKVIPSTQAEAEASLLRSLTFGNGDKYNIPVNDPDNKSVIYDSNQQLKTNLGGYQIASASRIKLMSGSGNIYYGGSRTYSKVSRALLPGEKCRIECSGSIIGINGSYNADVIVRDDGLLPEWTLQCVYYGSVFSTIRGRMNADRSIYMWANSSSDGLDSSNIAIYAYNGEWEYANGILIKVDGVTLSHYRSTNDNDTKNGALMVKDLGINTAKLADSAVSTAKIANKAMTFAKLADALIASVININNPSTQKLATEKAVSDIAVPQYLTMPNPVQALLNKIVLYIGETTESYENGNFYKCVLEGEVYTWVKLDFGGGSSIAFGNTMIEKQGVWDTVLNAYTTQSTDRENRLEGANVDIFGSMGSGTYVYWNINEDEYYERQHLYLDCSITKGGAGWDATEEVVLEKLEFEGIGEVLGAYLGDNWLSGVQLALLIYEGGLIIGSLTEQSFVEGDILQMTMDIDAINTEYHTFDGRFIPCTANLFIDDNNNLDLTYPYQRLKVIKEGDEYHCDMQFSNIQITNVDLLLIDDGSESDYGRVCTLTEQQPTYIIFSNDIINANKIIHTEVRINEDDTVVVSSKEIA